MVAPIKILCTTKSDIKYTGSPWNESIPIVTYTEHWIISDIINGLIIDLNVKATTINIETSVKSDIKLNSESKEMLKLELLEIKDQLLSLRLLDKEYIDCLSKGDELVTSSRIDEEIKKYKKRRDTLIK